MKNTSGLKPLPRKYDEGIMREIIMWRTQITNIEGILPPRECVLRLMKIAGVGERTAKLWVRKAEMIYEQMKEGKTYQEAHDYVTSLMYKNGDLA